MCWAWCWQPRRWDFLGLWAKTVAQRREKEPKKKKRKSNHAQCDTDYTIINISIFLASSYLSYIAEAEEQTLKSNDHTARQSTCCVYDTFWFVDINSKNISFWYYLVININGCGCTVSRSNAISVCVRVFLNSMVDGTADIIEWRAWIKEKTADRIFNIFPW